MKIAIHNDPNSFSNHWSDYCRENSIDYKLVDCYQSNIIQEINDCDILMWHFNHTNAKDMLFARQLLFSLESSGKKVFPDFKTSWHFNDKVGQKYLLESINAPLVSSYVFYNKEEALAWAKKTSFPKVFKLRGGAGSENVRLIRTSQKARKIIRKAFKTGFRKYDYFGSLRDRIMKYKEGNATIVGILKSMIHLVFANDFVRSRKELSRILGNEKGYIYFQDFIPENQYDIRVIIIGDKAFAIKRLVRKNDFRASGSGKIIYDVKQIDIRCIEISFEVTERLNTQCLAFDFIFNKANEPKITEISYGFLSYAYVKCEGYWDKDLVWHEGEFNPYGWMIENLIR